MVLLKPIALKLTSLAFFHSWSEPYCLHLKYSNEHKVGFPFFLLGTDTFHSLHFPADSNPNMLLQNTEAKKMLASSLCRYLPPSILTGNSIFSFVLLILQVKSCTPTL